MEKKQTKKVRLFYMYFDRGNGMERSPEYRSYKEFYDACGVWCSAHPFDWQPCHRDAIELVG